MLKPEFSHLWIWPVSKMFLSGLIDYGTYRQGTLFYVTYLEKNSCSSDKLAHNQGVSILNQGDAGTDP